MLNFHLTDSDDIMPFFKAHKLLITCTIPLFMLGGCKTTESQVKLETQQQTPSQSTSIDPDIRKILVAGGINPSAQNAITSTASSQSNLQPTTQMAFQTAIAQGVTKVDTKKPTPPSGAPAPQGGPIQNNGQLITPPNATAYMPVQQAPNATAAAVQAIDPSHGFPNTLSLIPAPPPIPVITEITGPNAKKSKPYIAQSNNKRSVKITLEPQTRLTPSPVAHVEKKDITPPPKPYVPTILRF